MAKEWEGRTKEGRNKAVLLAKEPKKAYVEQGAS